MTRICYFTLPVCAMMATGLAGFSADAQAPPVAPVDEYAIHADGGIIYDPLRREAEKTGQLARYDNAATTEHTLDLPGFELTVQVPEKADAYDVIPVPYVLKAKGDADRFPVAVQAVAFEETARRGDHVFDLAMPNDIRIDVQFLGSVTAHMNPGARHNLAPDYSDEPKHYPPFSVGPVRTSDVVEAGDLVWFLLRITNTGDTILDPDGYGGSLFYPHLLREDETGEYEVIGGMYNMYHRDTEYLYPGESHDIWFHLSPHPQGHDAQGFAITPGNYRFRLPLVTRRYVDPMPLLNIWDGPQACSWEIPFTVAEQPGDTPPPQGEMIFVDETDKRTRFIHTFEEFMTAFDCHLAPPEEGTGEIRGTLHLQVAPWTEHVVVKLITGGPVEGVSVAVPINVSTENLRVQYRPQHQGVFFRDGLAHPVIASQTMADMRSNVQVGPWPEHHIPERFREMMDCGINVVATTSMPWLYADLHDPAVNHMGDAMKYALDTARDTGMIVQGWGTYPFDRSPVIFVAGQILGEEIPIEHFTLGGHAISMAEPNLARANAVVWNYQFKRWGDLYHQDGAGLVPIGVEDSRGWMRQDINIRYEMGTAVAALFREWLKDKYGDIASVNTAWGSDFASFDAIDPEKDQVANPFGHIWEYTDPTHPFHDWNAAVGDLDIFRTELRVQNYRDTLALVREEIPAATICLRTEGGNVMVSGIDPADPNSHMRHIYYSQRRCAMIAETMIESGLVKYHSDYTTMPYTPSELRELTRGVVAGGIIPTWLPQFNNMRDIAINAKYGTDYQVHYNLPEPRKGYMMHNLTALVPWFTAVYEEGGIPGILWEDLQCDGFATETQKREMRLFKKLLDEAISTPEALADRASYPEVETAWRDNATPMRSYLQEETAAP